MTKPRQIVEDHVEAVSLISDIFSVLQGLEEVTDRRQDFYVRKVINVSNAEIYIREIHTEPANSYNHEHIIAVGWNTKEGVPLSQESKAVMVSWLNQGGQNQAFVSVGSNIVRVVVIEPTAPKLPYLRTVEDGTPTDNLLTLRRFSQTLISEKTSDNLSIN